MKGKACDCVGLPLMIAGELGIVDTHGQPLSGETYKNYGPQPEGTLVLDLCVKHLVRGTVNAMQPGDVVVMRVPSTPCHVGIYSGVVNGAPSLIHAYAGVDKCVEHGIDAKWRRRIVAVFSFPGVE
jgi:cell wall-associated NlpC family hydrolase